MSTWILIISISVSHGVSLESIEFTSKETCEIAQSKAIEELDRFLNKVQTVCVEK